jgi:hypothetical protein
MATIEVRGWKENHVGWTGWDNNARSELSKRLRRSVDGSPADIKRAERLARARSPFVIENVRPEHIESLRQILETMGADATVQI